MHKSLGAAAVSLALLSLPAVADAAPTEVDGNRFPSSGLVRLVHGCNDPDATPVEAPEFLVKRGPGKTPLGQYSSGWKVMGSQFGAGSATQMSSPSSLSVFRISVNSPGGETHGSAVATYHPPLDEGYWVGLAPMDLETRKGWHTVNAANRIFTWEHYSSTGTVDRTGPPNTIATHATTYGGDGEGAELGFVFGCNGKPFYTDRLQVVSDDDDLVFDYGGFRTRVELRLGTRKPNRTTITVGKRLDLKGRLFQKYVGGRLEGPLQFQSKPLKGGSWRTFRKVSASRRDPAAIGVTPSRNTAYRITYPGTATEFENDVSHVLKVVVKMRATASFADPTITRGDSYAAVGRVRPGKRTGVQLQRFVNGAWRTIRTGTTSSTGGFRIGGTAQDAGVSYWRVKVNGGATNADAISGTFKLTVATPPPSGGGGGGGGGGNDDPPPPPPPEG